MKKLLSSAFILFFSSYLSFSQTTVSTSGNKYALIETTGAALVQYEPDGTAYLENLKSTYSKVICVQHHMPTGKGYPDAMGTTEGGDWLTAFGVTGFPMGIIDRTVNSSAGTNIYTGRNNWSAAVNQRLSTTANYDVTLTYFVNKATRVITASVTGTALVTLTGDYHFNVYVVEDSVSGSGSGYDQVNYYNTVSGHMFFGAGNPIVGFKHRQVQRAMLGGLWGTYAVTSPVASTSVTKSFTYTVPSGYDINKISLIGVVQKQGATVADREIMNAIQTSKLSTSCPPPVIAPICVVTRDSATNKNMIVWEKTGMSFAKTYRIHRETSTPGVYTLLTSQAANIFSTYIDMTSSPSTTSYRYKLTVEDSCSNEIPVTDTSIHHHRTVLVTSSLSGTSVILNWNLYEGRGFTNAIVMESVSGGTFTPLITLPPTATTYTITVPSSGSVAYRVDIVVPGGGCAPSKSTAYNIISSNIVYPFATDINTAKANNSTFKFYPNPVTDYLIVEGVNINDELMLYDAMGRKLANWKIIDDKQALDFNGIADGFYILTITDAKTGKRNTANLQKM